MTFTLSQLPADYDLAVYGPPGACPARRCGRTRCARTRSARTRVPGPEHEPDRSGALPADTVQDIPIRPNPIRPNRSARTSCARVDHSRHARTRRRPSWPRGRPGQGADGGRHLLQRCLDPKPYVLRVKVTQAPPAPPCQTTAAAVGRCRATPLPTSVPSRRSALILVNEQRMAARENPAADPRACVGADQLAAATDGLVVPVDVPRTKAAYDGARRVAVLGDAANGVVPAIDGVVDQVLQGQRRPPAAAHDPARRARPDHPAGARGRRHRARQRGRVRGLGGLRRARQRGLARPARGLPAHATTRSATSTRCRASTSPTSPSAGSSSRAGQIADQIDAFLGQRHVAPTRAFVTGYDFLADGAQATLDALKARRPAGSDLADRESWTADAGALRRQRRRRVVHVAQRSLRPVPRASRGRQRRAVGRADHEQRGHARARQRALQRRLPRRPEPGGRSRRRRRRRRSRSATGPRRCRPRKSLYAGNTGFGYGDTAAVALLREADGRLRRPAGLRQVTAGQALMFAKQAGAAALIEHATTTGARRSMEATFYGIAMYSVGAERRRRPASALPPCARRTGRRASAREHLNTIAPQFTRRDTDRGSFWTANGEDPLVIQHRPTQPRVTRRRDAADGAPVHGALIEALTTVGARPASTTSSARPVGGLRPATSPSRTPATAFFPAQLLARRRVQTTGGMREQLTLRGRPGARGRPAADRQRDRARRSARTAPTSSRTSITPRGRLVGGRRLSLSVDVSTATRTSGACCTARTPGRLALVSAGQGRSGTARRAAARSPRGATRIVEAMVWVYDTPATSPFSNSKVVGYSFDPVHRQAGDPRVIFQPAPPPSGYYSRPPTVSLDPGAHGGAAFEYAIDGGPWKPYSGPFAVRADRPRASTWCVSAAATARTALNRFAVDNDGPTVDASATTAPNANGLVSRAGDGALHLRRRRVGRRLLPGRPDAVGRRLRSVGERNRHRSRGSHRDGRRDGHQHRPHGADDHGRAGPRRERRRLVPRPGHGRAGPARTRSRGSCRAATSTTVAEGQGETVSRRDADKAGQRGARPRSGRCAWTARTRPAP